MMNDTTLIALIVVLLVAFLSLYRPNQRVEFLRETLRTLPGLFLYLIVGAAVIIVLFPLFAAVYTVFFVK